MNNVKEIYFLINNEYQLLDTKKHLVNFNKKRYKITILNGYKSKKNLKKYFKNIKVINLNLPQIRYTFAWFLSAIKFFKFNRKIKYSIKTDKNSFLFFYNEVSLGNHLVVKFFKKNASKVLLINDAGLATYLTFSDYSEKNKSKLWIMRKFLTNLVPYLGDTRLVRSCRYNYYFWLPDKYIDGVIGYNFFKNRRKFPTHYIRDKKKNISKNIKNNRILYFNSNEYEDGFLTINQYLDITHKIISKLLKSYSKVIFKFHPRESKEIINFINNRYFSNKKVKILNPSNNYQTLINDLKIKNIASICSSAALTIPYKVNRYFYFRSVMKFFPLNFEYVLKKQEHLLMSWGGKKSGKVIKLPQSIKVHKNQKYFDNLEKLVRNYSSANLK